jgi:oxygen-independent coproporphyrinogen-3 oxidase
MVDSISKELYLQKSFVDNERIETIYFGGGTPSILEINELQQLLDNVFAHYNIVEHSEITLEANPDDLAIDKLHQIKSLGVNRLSIGIQSFNSKTLSFLNRVHSANEAMACIGNARKAGFDNLSIDLIFSIPGHSIADVAQDLAQAISINPEHISVYGLTIEETTVFGNWHKKGKFKQTSDAESADQFELIISKLEQNGFEQYEISNFCRDENYAKHNTSYWQNVKYLGVGPGAHSFDGKARQFNMANNHLYMKALEEGRIPFEKEVSDEKSMANEYLMTSLRTKWGCDLELLRSKYKYPLSDNHMIENLIKAKLITQDLGKIFLTKKGKFLADSVISELFWI